jgi:Reverse transcriptase (RNA-dependent DNA polymerase)
VTSVVVCRMVGEAADKYSMKDPMPTWLLKSCIDLLAPYIATAFNLSLSSGIFPSGYKDAYVTPRLKKPTLPHSDLASYRPISNLSFLSKLLERVASVQLTEHLTSAGLLPPHQSAYRKWHSTETALLKVVTDLTEAMDAGHHALLGLLDLSAAFDTVDHDILVERLSRSFGIRSVALDWLRSYLSCRRQSVFFDGIFSSVRSLHCGVPQGSVLGPLLFLLYTADVGDLATSLGLSSHFYADDSQIYTSGPPSTALQQRIRMERGIERIADWMRSNRLRLNPEKTDFLWCATSRRCVNLDTSALSICGAMIAPSSFVRDLGVLLESDLSMRRHVAWTVGCCFRQLRLIRSCIKSLPFEAAKSAVAAFVTCKVDGCNSLLAGAPQCLLDGLQSVLNAAARLLCNRRKYDHVTPLLRDVLHWLPVPQRIEYKLCLLVFKSLRGMAPDYLHEYCAMTHSSASGLQLRSLAKTDLRVRMMKTCFGDRAFSAAGPRCWNGLPAAIRSADSVDSFKAKLKFHLFSKAYPAYH